MPPPKSVLFVGSADRVAAAVRAFNGIAGRMRLPWRGVAVDPAPAVRVEVDGEFWASPDAEANVSALVARLLGGRADAPLTPPPPPPAPKKQLTAKVSRETAGRRGKGVTVVSDLPVSEADLQQLATLLKSKCGTGGTAKDGRIEIQGDQRDRIAAELEKLGYKVKRAGG
jgi:predicted translation initiation factor SUI1